MWYYTVARRLLRLAHRREGQRRGATRCELQYLNDELRTVYGRDLTSVSFPADRTSRDPYTDLEDSEEDPGPLHRG